MLGTAHYVAVESLQVLARYCELRHESGSAGFYVPIVRDLTRVLLGCSGSLGGKRLQLASFINPSSWGPTGRYRSVVWALMSCAYPLTCVWINLLWKPLTIISYGGFGVRAGWPHRMLNTKYAFTGAYGVIQQPPLLVGGNASLSPRHDNSTNYSTNHRELSSGNQEVLVGYIVGILFFFRFGARRGESLFSP